MKLKKIAAAGIAAMLVMSLGIVSAAAGIPVNDAGYVLESNDAYIDGTFGLNINEGGTLSGTESGGSINITLVPTTVRLVSAISANTKDEAEADNVQSRGNPGTYTGSHVWIWMIGAVAVVAASGVIAVRMRKRREQDE